MQATDAFWQPRQIESRLWPVAKTIQAARTGGVALASLFTGSGWFSRRALCGSSR